MMDSSVLTALGIAVDNDPENLPLRLHLANLLLDDGQAQSALEHYAFVLSRQPVHLEGLEKAARAADALGNKDRADGYRRLHQALSWDRARNMVESIEEKPLSETARKPAPPPPTEQVSNSDEEEVRVRIGPEHGEADSPWDVEESDVTLADVAGMEDVKRRLNIAFLAPMKNPDMRKLYGKSLRGGLLLYGPPGCGKTFIARATAGELGARFLSIALSDVLDMFLGASERNLHSIFETARRNRPCVLFFDEVDALGRKRSQMRHWGGNVVNQLLTELDSVSNNNDGVFILAATNHPWDVDTALRRPGRLDRTLLVLPPDAPAREALIRLQMRGRPIETLDYATLAAKTDGFSGADVVHLCDSAAELALEDSLERGIARPIGQKDFQRALREVSPSVRAWFETAKHYAQFSNEGGVYDDLLQYLRVRKLL